MKLSTRINLLITLLVLCIGIVSSVIVSRQIYTSLMENQDGWIKTLVHSISDSISRDIIDRKVVNSEEFLRSIVARETTIEYVYVIDFNGKIFSHTFESGFPRQLLNLNHLESGHTDSSMTFQTSSGTINEFVHALIDDMDAHIHLGINQSQISEIVTSTSKNILAITFTIALIGAALSFFISRRISFPLVRLAKEISVIGEGENKPLEISSNDIEINQLIETYNKMIVNKNKTDAEILSHRVHLQDMVDEKTHELRVARDHALKSTKAKSVFLANMSHELRTPMNSIIGFTGILKDELAGPINEEQKSQLVMIYNSAQQLLNLINDILDLSKVEAGKMEVVFEVFSPYKMINELSNLMQTQASQKKIELTFETQDIPEFIYGDKSKLRQILVNLIGNAIKFTSEGCVTVRTKSSESEKALIFDVEDTGIGIPDSQKAKVFGAFSQVDSGDTKSHEGTGLGLAITQEFIQLLNGKIELETKLGKGSCFRIEIPFSEIKAVSNNVSLKNRGNAEYNENNRRVLIIDDQEDALSLLNTYLEQQNYEVICCQNALESVELAKSYQPFAITLDIVMPETDGWSTLVSLKNDSETAHIPVIVVSVLDDKNLGLSLGAIDYIQKPINAARLNSILAKLKMVGNEILIVEDGAQDAELLKIMLDGEGYHISHAVNGESALKQIAVSPPDIILLDLMMPDMSGFEVIHHVRTIYNLYMPIVVVSAKVLTNEEKKYLTENFVNVLVKGQFTRSEMLISVKDALQRIEFSMEDIANEQNIGS